MSGDCKSCLRYVHYGPWRTRPRATRQINFELGDTFAEALTEATQSLVCVLDRDGTFMLFNDACERATGFTRQEVLGRPAFESVIPAEEAEAFREVLAFIWRTGH